MKFSRMTLIGVVLFTIGLVALIVSRLLEIELYQNIVFWLGTALLMAGGFMYRYDRYLNKNKSNKKDEEQNKQ